MSDRILPDIELLQLTEAGASSASEIAALFELCGFGKAQDYLSDERFPGWLCAPGCFCMSVRDASANILVGFVRVMSDDHMVSNVTEICVHPSYRRRGVGTALMYWARRRFFNTAI
jgi:ribosomal protein S18 acetylase RimI-like enzyme